MSPKRVSPSATSAICSARAHAEAAARAARRRPDAWPARSRSTARRRATTREAPRAAPRRAGQGAGPGPARRPSAASRSSFASAADFAGASARCAASRATHRTTLSSCRRRAGDAGRSTAPPGDGQIERHLAAQVLVAPQALLVAVAEGPVADVARRALQVGGVAPPLRVGHVDDDARRGVEGPAVAAVLLAVVPVLRVLRQLAGVRVRGVEGQLVDQDE